MCYLVEKRKFRLSIILESHAIVNPVVVVVESFFFVIGLFAFDIARELLFNNYSETLANTRTMDSFIFQRQDVSNEQHSSDWSASTVAALHTTCSFCCVEFQIEREIRRWVLPIVSSIWMAFYSTPSRFTLTACKRCVHRMGKTSPRKRKCRWWASPR